MALYLGGEKLGIIPPMGVSSAVNRAEGMIRSDEDGIITFPKLDFIPTIIAVWNIETVDLKQEAEDSGEAWDDSWVQFIHRGFMLLALYQDGVWITQAVGHSSGEIYITNASISRGPHVWFNHDTGRYIYQLNCSPEDVYEVGQHEYKYVIYG